MLVKQINQNNQLINLFNKPIVGSEKIKMNGKVYFMMIDRLTEVKRHKKIDSNIHTKKCMNCGVEKSVNYFYTNNSSNDNYSNRCKSCDDSVQRNYLNNLK